MYWWMHEMYSWCNLFSVGTSDPNGVKEWRSVLCRGWNLANGVCLLGGISLKTYKTLRLGIIVWIIFSIVDCCLCAQWLVMNGGWTLQTSWSWPLKVSLWFASLCELIMHTIRQGEGKFSAALMSWSGSWKGQKCLSVRKKEIQGGWWSRTCFLQSWAGKAAHLLVELQLWCKAEILCLEDTMLGFITAGWERG